MWEKIPSNALVVEQVAGGDAVRALHLWRAVQEVRVGPRRPEALVQLN